MKPRYITLDTEDFNDDQIPVFDEDAHRFIGKSRSSDGGASELNDLSDVLINSPQDGEVLAYSNGEWTNTTQTGGGAVDSVNGQTGVVLLDYDDVGAASAVDLSNHTSDQNNPHEVTKSQVGLGNVTNDAQIALSQLDTDTTLAADSDARVPSQKAVKAYVDANSGGGGGGSVTSVTASLPLESSGGNAPNISLKKPTGNAGSDEAVFGDDTRLSDARVPTGGAGGVLSGNYPSPGFAVDMATQDELDNAITQRGIPAGGSAGQVLAKQSSANYAVEWVNQSGGGGGSITVTDGTTSVSDATKLTFDGASVSSEGGGEAKVTISGGAGELNDLSDVEIGSPTTGQVLTYDGSKWANSDAQGGGGGGQLYIHYPIPKAAYGRYLMGSAGWTSPTGSLPSEAVTRSLWIPDLGVGLTLSPDGIFATYDGNSFAKVSTTEINSPTYGGAYWMPEARRVIVLGNESTPLYRSGINDITTWTPVSGAPLPSERFNALYYNSSTKLLVGRCAGRIYYSEDYGETWTQGGDGAYWNNETIVFGNGGRRAYVMDNPSGALKMTNDFGLTWQSVSVPGNYEQIAYDEQSDILAIGRYLSTSLQVRKGLNQILFTNSSRTYPNARIFYNSQLGMWSSCSEGNPVEYSFDLRNWQQAAGLTGEVRPDAYSEELGIIITSGRSNRLKVSPSAFSYPFRQAS